MEAFDTPFPHVFLEGEYGVGSYPKTTDEMDILRLESCIRDKPDWETKINDPQIVSKWRQEVENMVPRIDKSVQKMDYVLKELQWVVGTKDAETGIQMSTVDGTYHSDTLVSDSLRQELISGVELLENVDESQKDWHPGSNEQVLDLVHPSLFPLVIGKSPILAKPFEPQPRELSQQNEPNYNHLLYFAKKEHLLPPEEAEKLALNHVNALPTYSKSKVYQWLPSDVKIDENGRAQFTSYINNLHPEHHPKLYYCLENILTKFVPMFEKVLTDLRNPRKNRITLDSDWYEETERPEEELDDSDYSDDENVQKVFKPMPIPEFETPSNPEKVVKLNGRMVQVITKLANIHLTPEKPSYPGGVWHLEGMANERIIASGIYYYSNDNITESLLHFRQVIQEPDYEQYDENGVYTIYHLRDEEALNQGLGSILTKQGRCIAFPNILQHKVAPFKLLDQTRPGYRKILVFFLVDPSVKIISTSQVPPQQRSWFLDEMDKEPTSVPDLVVHKIVGMMEWPLSMEDAKKKRDELMKERKYFVENTNESLFERPFSLCEH